VRFDSLDKNIAEAIYNGVRTTIIHRGLGKTKLVGASVTKWFFGADIFAWSIGVRPTALMPEENDMPDTRRVIVNQIFRDTQKALDERNGVQLVYRREGM
jgi:hypothetical protein